MAHPSSALPGRRIRWLSCLLSALFMTATVHAQSEPVEAPQTPQQRVAKLKAWMKTSQMQLRHYEWVETTTITHDGKEVSRSQKNCYYDVTGQLQKVMAGETEESSARGGPLRRRIAERKKTKLEDYMHRAEALVHEYVPPDPDAIQMVVNSGNMSMQMLVPGRKVQLTFNSYKLPGDSLRVQVELPDDRLMGVDVASYLDDQKDAVTLASTMDVLPDGTIYTAQSVLDAPAKKVQVTVQNSGYRPSQ